MWEIIHHEEESSNPAAIHFTHNRMSRAKSRGGKFLFYALFSPRVRCFAVNYSACLDRHVLCVTPWLFFFFPEFHEDPTVSSKLLIFFFWRKRKNGHNVLEVVTTQVLHP